MDADEQILRNMGDIRMIEKKLAAMTSLLEKEGILTGEEVEAEVKRLAKEGKD
ncbi:hypothetical protein J4212_00350 [Candidatus Woesearchaeota archaeon]|nr:hypothetical protein [Candidatus Woesearchaeota archaeon]